MITFVAWWLIAATLTTAIICRAIHNTKALERAGINARFEA